MDDDELDEFFYQDDYYAHEAYDAQPFEDDCYETDIP